MARPVNFWRPKEVEIAVTEAIRDRTTVKNMTPRAVAQLKAAAQAAQAAGLAELRVVAARGGGHLSHRYGTEWDLMGYNADGSKWSREQRVAVAQGGREAGADRFGLYEYGASHPTADGRLHMGYSGKAGPAAMWGAGGHVRGAKSRRFTNETERAFARSVTSGKPFDALAHVSASDRATAYAPAPETSAAPFDAVLNSAAYLGDGPQPAGTPSPVPMLSDPSFLPMKTEPAALDKQQVADVQAILVEQGFDPGPLDGITRPAHGSGSGMRSARRMD